MKIKYTSHIVDYEAKSLCNQSWFCVTASFPVALVHLNLDAGVLCSMTGCLLMRG